MFEGIDDADMLALVDALRVHQLVPGDIVFQQGDSGSAMYIVASGEICIHLPGSDPVSRVILATLPCGTCFGELAIFDDKPRSASALATCDTVLLELGQDALLDCMRTRPSVALGILRTMSERLRGVNAMLTERTTRTEAQRKAQMLRWSDRLAHRVSAFNGSWTFLLLLTGATIAWSIVNLHRLSNHAPDPYPYIFYNLVIAIFIALQWPLIAMAQNRRAAQERAAAELDYKINLKNETHCEALLAELRLFRKEWAGHEEEIAGLLALGSFSMLPHPPATKQATSHHPSPRPSS